MEKRQMLTIGFVGIAVVVLVNLVIVLFYFLLTRSSPNVSEAPLNPNGESYEINPDDSGWLWISDFSSHEIWGIDPISGAYTVYPVSDSPVDARQAGGWLWWASGQSNVLGRIKITDLSLNEWQIPEAVGFLGTNLDDQGRMYATDSSNPFLYRLDPNLTQLCIYGLPGYGSGNYIVRDGDYLWVGDYVDSIMMRLQVSTDQLTWWSLPEGSSPLGMAVDEQGNIWYADSGLHVISQLDPNSNQLASYALSGGIQPEMVAVHLNTVWYTEQAKPNFFSLDSLNVNHTIVPLAPKTDPLTPDCNNISPSSTGSILTRTGQMNWSEKIYRTKSNQDGLLSFQMPNNSKPQGIAFSNTLYVVDRGRQVLINLLLTQEAPSSLAIKPTFISTSTPSPTATPTSTPQPEHFINYLPIIFSSELPTP